MIRTLLRLIVLVVLVVGVAAFFFGYRWGGGRNPPLAQPAAPSRDMLSWLYRNGVLSNPVDIAKWLYRRDWNGVARQNGLSAAGRGLPCGSTVCFRSSSSPLAFALVVCGFTSPTACV